jgi:hypothetical protein
MTPHLISTPQRYPASYYQRDWVLACRDATSFWSTPLAWDLYGPVEPELLTRALADLVERHDALRTAFRTRGRDVEQLVWPSVDVRLRTVDLAGTDNPVAELEDRLVREAEQPRLLDRPPLWHVQLVRLRPGHHVLAMFIHHLVFDGWSHGVLHDELVRCLRAAVRGRPPRLPALHLGVGEFASLERTLRDRDAERWWSDQLDELPPVTPALPLGGRFVSCPLPPVPAESGEDLQQLADEVGVGVNEALLATVVAVRRLEVGDDVVLGVTRARRDEPESRRVIGPLLDHLPVRVDTSGGITVGELLERVHQSYREARRRTLPLGLIRQVVRSDLAATGGRLYDTRFNYMPSASSGEAVLDGPDGGLRIVPRALDPARLRPRHTEDHPEVLPLSVNLHHQRDGQLTGDVCGHDQVYPGTALAELGERLVGTLDRIVRGGGGQRLPG